MIKLWILLAFAGHYIGLCAMSFSREINKKEIIVRRIRVPALKNFNVCSDEQSYTDETIDLNQIDWCTKKAFYALSQAKFVQKLRYILARVTTEAQNSVQQVEYCDAHALNIILMGSYYVEPPYLLLLDHPITKQPLKNIEYYTLLLDKKTFRFMFSYADLCDGSSDSIYLKYVLLANQTIERRLQQNAQLKLRKAGVDVSEF